MQGKIFKVKNFEVIQKSSKSVKIFSLKIFRLYMVFADKSNLREDTVLISKKEQNSVVANSYMYTDSECECYFSFLECHIFLINLT